MDDICEEDHGDTVADTVLIDLLSQPHNEGRARTVAGDHNDRAEGLSTLGGNDSVGVLHQEVVTDTCHKSKRNGYVASDVIDLLAAFLAFLGHSLKGGDCYAEKLHNDG